jgi:aminopeptidase
MNENRLQKYARLIAQKGGNIQKGQEVYLYAQLDQPQFVEMLVEECYKCGASRVFVEWGHQNLTRLHVKYVTEERLGAVEPYEEAKWQLQRDKLPVKIYLLSEDPDGLNGIDQAKYSKASQNRNRVFKPYRDAMENKYQWCIAAVPGKEWAEKVFPDAKGKEAVEKLWEAILEVSRVTDDPIGAWEEHNSDLKNRCDYLNGLGLKKLHYTASNGTDLTVGLMDETMFLGGGEVSLQGIPFNANIPTEEVFATPKRGEADGIVYSSKPLSYRGQVIDNFSIRFEKGKAVEVKAGLGEDLLKELIAMDEGASYLGECALVPYDSPIRNSELLFYNTLFDENAACHLALGMGFANCVRDFENRTLEECRKLGVNDSIIHEDFMIGTKDLAIDGIDKDGKEIAIFRDGNWAF